VAHSSPILHGLMTEEINHSYDGGLYAELVSNRTFQDDAKMPVHWSLVRRAGGSGSISLDAARPANAVFPTSLRLEVTTASGPGPVGVANDGFWGIPVRSREHYRISLLARASGGASEEGAICVALESADGSVCYASATVDRVGNDWARHALELFTGDIPVDGKGRLVITSSRPGTLWLSLVSCFPRTWNERPNGNRVDLMRVLAGLHPSFLRFPGGNYLEGDTTATRFDWKTTLHGLEQRPGHPQPWGYRSSDGLGLLEFLEWCEDLRMQPVLAVYAGYSFNPPVIRPGPALVPFVQDALDEIEYVTGGAGSRWGAVRAADGHPAPFGLTYVEIGNEDPPGQASGYDGRFAQFYDAIKTKYPRLQVIATSRVSSRTPDVVDEHYYLPAARMEAETHRFDGYPRSGPRIFVGEWATVEGTPWKTVPGTPTPDLRFALADAAWMTGLERNSDLVIMASYAPLLVNVNPGGWQWQTNLIGYDGLSCYGSPSYYAQAMFGGNRGDLILASSQDDPKGFFHSVTGDSRTGDIILKAVNTTAGVMKVLIEIDGVASAGPTGTAVTLASGHPEDSNSIGEPAKVVPVVSALAGIGARFERAFAPYSITVIRIPAR
jgi:alpha-N-arabinofuranosidase